MNVLQILFFAALTLFSQDSKTVAAIITDDNFLEMPAVGANGLRILSPTLLELTLITTKEPAPARPTQWDFVGNNSQLQTPAPDKFAVNVGKKTVAVDKVGFRRRPIYAPLKKRDLRIGNYLYLHLANPIADGETVEVKNTDSKLWSAQMLFRAATDPLRWSPAIHVNQEGYCPAFVKKAMIGYFLGSMGELELPKDSEFRLLNTATGKPVFSGKLVTRRDVGYTYAIAPYRQVLEADFSGVKEPGEYRIQVAGLGTSFPFRIDDGVAANFTRTYALGMYHQRCGAANELPFTRFTHGPCHTGLVEVPTMKFATVNEVLGNETGNFSSNKRHTARQLKNVDASLYPFINKNKIDVSGGYHDAGDYSKYTINSAQLIHTLVFAADCFNGVGALDNLGLPESGDGKSDFLQLAKWEADFLAKMQDTDGGFYFLVYPKDRQYEHDVLPDKGDPQVVFPKTTASTAAAVAALAQIGSSPLFKKQFPEAAINYLAKAKKGWAFLEKAIEKNGRDGSYQKITHYGDEFMHDDELAWAATELFLATGEKKFEKELIEHFKPNDRETKRWTWWSLFESYGCAIRSYAFAVKTKRLQTEQLDSNFLKLCEDEIISAARDQLRYANENAYATSFPSESKRFRNAGWYFSTDRAFELATACQIDFPRLNDPRPQFLDAIIGNMNYEAGCNPVNVSFITGIGWKRPREMVHHYAQNDWRVIPPSGLAFGNIQEGFPFLDPYQKELGTLTFPPDGDEEEPTPFYDRWGDTFNTSTEFVTVNLGRSLATTAFLMAQTPVANQKWQSNAAKIVISQTPNQKKISAIATSPVMNLREARVLWEIQGNEPVLLWGGKALEIVPTFRGSPKIEAEVQFADGRRLFGATNLTK
ncbi:MAG: glycoside hydrolase family 9 protein [Verrucomicrobiota bacterium]